MRSSLLALSLLALSSPLHAQVDMGDESIPYIGPQRSNLEGAQGVLKLIKGLKDIKLPLSFCDIPREAWAGTHRDCKLADTGMFNAIYSRVEKYYANNLKEEYERRSGELQEVLDEAKKTRETWERKALGEGAGLGSLVDGFGVRIDDMLRINHKTFQSLLHANRDGIRSRIDEMIGTVDDGLAAHLHDAAKRKVMGNSDLFQAHAETAFDLERHANERSQALDKLYQQENLDGSISSGRAKQLALQVSILEAEVELDITRAKIAELRAAAGAAADGVSRLRLESSTSHAPISF